MFDYMTKRISFYNPIHSLLLLVVFASLTAFTPKASKVAESGTFTYVVNSKEFKIENMKAILRTTTGGKKQLSLSNDRFVKFFFIDPKESDFDLSSLEAKKAIVRYNEPGTNNIYTPKAGSVKISKLDVNAQTLSGEFEMVLVSPGKDKVITIQKGHFNVPIVVLR